MTQDPFRVLRARQKGAQEALGPEMGFSEGFGQTSYGTQRTFWDFVPFISSARSFKQVESLEGALERVSRGVGSDDDRKLVRRFYEENYRARNWTHTVGRVAAEAIPFAGEFWVGGAALKALGKGLQAAGTAERLTRFKNIADKLAKPFQAYNGYTQQLIKQAPVRGWALRGATVTAPGQLVAQYAIGSTVGGSRIRAGQYNNYIAHRYDMDVSGTDVAVRVADDSYGMWSNALPAAILDNYIEMFSESSGMALMHLPASIKLSMLGKKATPRTLAALKRKEKGLGSAKLRSFLGIDPDPTYVKYWSDFGFQGLVPEIGEEFVGAISRDTIAAVAPGLADPGNTKHLIENLPAITLGMGLGMFGPATLHSGQNHADMAIARSKMSPEQADAFRELTKYVQDPAVKQRIGRALLQLDNAVVQGMTAAGTGEVAIDEILEGRWVTSENVKQAAKERIRTRAQTQNNEPDFTEGSVDKEVLTMLDEIRALPLADRKAGLSPVIDALTQYGVIAEEEAEMLLGEYDRRMKELLRARDKGVLADLLDDLGLQRLKNELIRTKALGLEEQEASDPAKPGETRTVGGNPALRLGAYRQRERVKRQLENSRQESNDRTWLDDDGLLALQDIVLGMPLTETAEQYGQAALTREALEQRLEYRAYFELARTLAERLGPDGIEIRPSATINPPKMTRSMLWLRKAGIRSLSFEGGQGAPLAIWDEEYGVLWLDHKKIAERGAQQQLVSPQAFEYGVILHEMVHIHVRRLGAEKGREWLDGIDEWLTNAGLPRDSVQKEMSAHVYKGQSEYARLEESVAFRLQRFGAVLQQEEKDQETVTGWRKWLRFVMDSLYEWAAPRTAMVQSVLRQRDMLDAAGIDTRGLSDPQVMMQLLTVEHVRMLLNVESDVGGVIYDSEKQLKELLNAVINDAIEAVTPDPEPVPLPEQVAAQEAQPEPEAAAEPEPEAAPEAEAEAAPQEEPAAEAQPEPEPEAEVELDPALEEIQQEMQFPEPEAIEPVPEDSEVSPATMTAIRQMYKLPQALAALAEMYEVEPESLTDVREDSPRRGKRALVADLQKLLAWNLDVIDLSEEELDDLHQAVNLDLEYGVGNYLETQEEEEGEEAEAEEAEPEAEEAAPEPVEEAEPQPEPAPEPAPEEALPTEQDTVNIWAGANENAILSNLYQFARRLVIDGRLYPSVEAYYQSNKGGFDLQTYNDYESFTYPSERIGPKIRGTKGTNRQISESVMRRALRARFLGDDDGNVDQPAIDALLATGNAQLTHNAPDGRTDYWTTWFPQELMKIRSELREGARPVAPQPAQPAEPMVPQAEAEALIGAEPKRDKDLTELVVVGRGRPERARLDELPLPISRQDPEGPQMVRRKNDKKGIGEEEVGRKPVYAEDTFETEDSPYVLDATQLDEDVQERAREQRIDITYDDLRAIQLHPNIPNMPREAMMPAAVHVNMVESDDDPGKLLPYVGAFEFGTDEFLHEAAVMERTYAIYNRLNSESDEAYYLVRIVRGVSPGLVAVEPVETEIGGLTPQLVVRTDSLYEPAQTATLQGELPVLYDSEGRLLDWLYDPIEVEDQRLFELTWVSDHGTRVIDVRQHRLEELADVVTRAGLELQASAPGMEQQAASLERARAIEAEGAQRLAAREEKSRQDEEGLPPQEPRVLVDSLLKHENRAYVVPTLAALLEQDEGIVREALRIDFDQGRISWNAAFFKRALRGRRREGSDERITTREAERAEAVAEQTFKTMLEPVRWDLQEFLQTGDVGVLRRTYKQLARKYGKKMYVLHQIEIGAKPGESGELIERMGKEALRLRILGDLLVLAREVRTTTPTAEQASRASEVVSSEAVRIGLEGTEEEEGDAPAAPTYQPATFTQAETKAIMGRMINLAVVALDAQVQGKPVSKAIEQPALAMLQQKGNYQWWVQWQTAALGLAPGELQVLMMASVLTPRSTTGDEAPAHRRIFESEREFKYSVLTRLVGVFGPVSIGPSRERGGFIIEDMHTVPVVSAANALDLVDTVFGHKGLSEPDYAYEAMIMAPLLANENWDALLDAMQKSELLAADEALMRRVRQALNERTKLLSQGLPDPKSADGRQDRAWRKRADARRQGERVLREALGTSELMQAVVDVATVLRMTVALRSQIQQDLVVAQQTQDGETADALLGAVSTKTAEVVADKLRDQLRIIEAVEGALMRGQYESAREILIHDHNRQKPLALAATSAFRKDAPSYLMSDMRDIARKGFDVIIQRRGSGERSVDVVYTLDPFALYDPYRVVPEGYEQTEELLRQIEDPRVAEEARLQERGYAGMIRHLLLRQVQDTESHLFGQLDELLMEFDGRYTAAFANRLRRLAKETGNDSERGAALIASVLKAVEAEGTKPAVSRNYSQAVFVALRDFMANEILLVPGDNGVRIISARTNAEVAIEAERETSDQDRDNLIITLAAAGEFGEGAWEELWGNIYGAVQQMAEAADAVAMRQERKLLNPVFDLGALRTEDRMALRKVMTKLGLKMIRSGEMRLPFAAFNKTRARKKPKSPKQTLRFMADPFYDEVPTGNNMNNGYVPPEVWDASRMPKGDTPEWSANAFLLAYDDWFRQVNRMQMEANARLAEFDDIIARFVDDEGIKGPARFRRIDLINEAILLAINVRGWMTEPGRAKAKSLGIGLDSVKTFDDFIRLFQQRYFDQQERLLEMEMNGQEPKLDPGETEFKDFTKRHYEVIKIAKLVFEGKDEWAELGFDAGYQARNGEYGGLAYVLTKQAEETTALAFRARLIKKQQLYYLNLAWLGEDSQPVYEVDEYGLIETAGAGGPFRQDVGARALERGLVGVLDGWQRGLRLRRPKATSSWHNSTRVIYEAMFNKAFVEGLKLSGIIVPMREAGTYQGFKRLKHKILRDYQAPDWVARYLNNALSQYGIRDIENGFYRGYMRLTIAAKHMMLMFGFFHHQAFMRSYLFTVRKQDAFGPMGVKGLVGMAKASLYSYGHAFGFVTQERLETMAKQFSPYAVGMKHIDEFTPELMMGIEEGLTIQRGNEVIGNPAGALYELDDEIEAEAWVKKAFAAIGKLGVSEEMQERGFQFIQNFRRGQRETAAWLFNSMGASLKAAAYMSEFRELQEKYHDRLKADFDGSYMRALARQAAKKINADFGGLNLRAREGKVSDLFKTGGPRDPRVQMALRALILAPDWTESNLFTILAALKKENVLAQPEEIDRMTKNVYRHMWLRVGSRALTIQAIINLLLSGVDPDRDLYDMYKEAGFFGGDEDTPSWWKFRWLDINASMFSPTESKKFVSVAGHFGDGLKWTADIINEGPLAPLERKGSVAMRAVVEAITGADYSGRRFTTLREITGTDYAAGTYQRKTTLADGTVKMPGDSKAGKYAGKLSRFSVKTGSVDLEQVLGGGYLWTQVFKFTPLQVRGMAEYILGQKDGFDLLMEMTGTKYGRTYVKE